MMNKINEEFLVYDWTDFCFRYNCFSQGGFNGSHVSIYYLDRVRDEFFLETSALRWSPYGQGADTATLISENCGVPYGLMSLDADIEHSKEDGRFRFDFDEILEKMRQVLGAEIPELLEISGEELREKFSKAKRYGHTMAFFSGPEFTVSMHLSWVAGPYSDFGQYLWESEGGVLMGPVYGTLPAEFEYGTCSQETLDAHYPIVGIDLLGSRIHKKYRRLPMFSKEEKKKASSLAEALALALTGKPPEYVTSDAE
jgi:hypothetical protein